MWNYYVGNGCYADEMIFADLGDWINELHGGSEYGGSEDDEDSGEDGESDYEGGGGGDDDDPEEDDGVPPEQLDRRGATPQDENAAPLEGGGGGGKNDDDLGGDDECNDEGGIEVDEPKSKAASFEATPDDGSGRASADNELRPCIDCGKAACSGCRW